MPVLPQWDNYPNDFNILRNHISLVINLRKKRHRRKKSVNVYNTYASTFTGKKTEKQAKNDAFHALLVIKGGGKPLITTNKLAGPVGGLGPPHPPSHYRNLSKRVSNITFMHRGRYASPNQLLVGQVRKAGITGRRARASRTFFNDSWQGSLFWQESYRILKEGLVVALCRPNLTI